jgi:hypothetical protein
VWLEEDDKRWLEEVASSSGTLTQSGLVRAAVSRLRREVESGRVKLSPGVFVEEEAGGD